jgi:hypothetical protein
MREESGEDRRHRWQRAHRLATRRHVPRARSRGRCAVTEIGRRHQIVQEDLVEASSIPYSISGPPKLIEFVTNIADAATDGTTVRLAPVLIQPMSAGDVASAVGEVSWGHPSTASSGLRSPSSSGSTNSSGTASAHVTIRMRWWWIRTLGTSVPSWTKGRSCPVMTRVWQRRASTTGSPTPPCRDSSE